MVNAINANTNIRLMDLVNRMTIILIVMDGTALHLVNLLSEVEACLPGLRSGKQGFEVP